MEAGKGFRKASGTKRKRTESISGVGMKRTKLFKVPVSVKRFVKKQINVTKEHKYFDTSFNLQTIPIAGNVDQLSTVPQGNTDTTRVGDKILPTSLEMNFQFVAVPADVTNYIRHIVFRWKPNTVSVTPAVASILAYAGTAQSPASPYYHDGRNQFEILYDKMYTFDAYNITKVIKETVPLARKTVNFVAGGNNGMGHLYQITLSDSGAVAHPTVIGYVRLNYTDA